MTGITPNAFRNLAILLALFSVYLLGVIATGDSGWDTRIVQKLVQSEPVTPNPFQKEVNQIAHCTQLIKQSVGVGKADERVGACLLLLEIYGHGLRSFQ